MSGSHDLDDGPSEGKVGWWPSACMALREAEGHHPTLLLSGPRCWHASLAVCNWALPLARRRFCLPRQATLFRCTVHLPTAMPTYRDHGCHGGLMDFAFDFILQNGGIDTEKDYKYAVCEEHLYVLHQTLHPNA